jgi:hypothetical protein
MILLASWEEGVLYDMNLQEASQRVAKGAIRNWVCRAHQGDTQRASFLS